MKWSVCIPNFNYARYLEEAIRSVLGQSETDFEVVIADNASTDNSVAMIRSFSDPRIRLHVNACNIGFSANLDRVGRMAQGEYMLVLSSDDLMRPDMLSTYRQFYDALGAKASQSILTATWDIIDSAGQTVGRKGPDPSIWTEADRRSDLDHLAGAPVYGMPAKQLLRRSLLCMRNPLNFAATCYPRTMFAAVEGYCSTRLINPDKWFNWKLLSVADMIYFIDRSLVGYRWHPANQTAIQAATGSLKFNVDEYVSTLELDDSLLASVGLDRNQVIEAFVEFDVARHGLATLARKQRVRARRIWNFGRATYPEAMRKNRKAWGLGLLLLLGPPGQWLAQWAYDYYLRRNARSG